MSCMPVWIFGRADMQIPSVNDGRQFARDRIVGYFQTNIGHLERDI